VPEGRSSSADEVFHALVGELDYPMFIVTAADGERRAGCLVGFATQCSIDPPRFLVCLSKNNRTFRVAQGCPAMAVHLVPEHAAELAELFGGETGDRTDKFSRCAWRPGPGGLPLLERCPDWFAGEIVERFDGGDHAGFVLAPFVGHVEHGGGQFPFHRAKRIDPGHEA
jgi:flavin reductase (DIM6/NTAB) family NADH-FMN oxidoreductase RutF